MQYDDKADANDIDFTLDDTKLMEENIELVKKNAELMENNTESAKKNAELMKELDRLLKQKDATADDRTPIDKCIQSITKNNESIIKNNESIIRNNKSIKDNIASIKNNNESMQKLNELIEKNNESMQVLNALIKNNNELTIKHNASVVKPAKPTLIPAYHAKFIGKFNKMAIYSIKNQQQSETTLGTIWKAVAKLSGFDEALAFVDFLKEGVKTYMNDGKSYIKEDLNSALNAVNEAFSTKAPLDKPIATQTPVQQSSEDREVQQQVAIDKRNATKTPAQQSSEDREVQQQAIVKPKPIAIKAPAKQTTSKLTTLASKIVNFFETNASKAKEGIISAATKVKTQLSSKDRKIQQQQTALSILKTDNKQHQAKTESKLAILANKIGNFFETNASKAKEGIISAATKVSKSFTDLGITIKDAFTTKESSVSSATIKADKGNQI